MAEILRGPKKGQAVVIDQWCNDWFTIKDGNAVSPLSLKLNEAELRDVRQSIEDGNAGIMGELFDLRDDGTFRKRSNG